MVLSHVERRHVKSWLVNKYGAIISVTRTYNDEL